jgi:hypothetical protein
MDSSTIEKGFPSPLKPQDPFPPTFVDSMWPIEALELNFPDSNSLSVQKLDINQKETRSWALTHPSVTHTQPQSRRLLPHLSPLSCSAFWTMTDFTFSRIVITVHLFCLPPPSQTVNWAHPPHTQTLLAHFARRVNFIRNSLCCQWVMVLLVGENCVEKLPAELAAV